MALFISPFTRTTDSNGLKINGAHRYFYLTGTLTPAAVYTSFTLGTPLSNPVVADAGGLFVPIYLDPAVTYRVIEKDAAGNVIQDIDPYIVDDSTASNMGYVYPGTGAALRTVQTRLQDFISVKDFGAKGDSSSGGGGTDDTAAIQAAINYINSVGGGTLYFPEGYYLITSYLTVCKYLTIIGTGRATQIVTAIAGGGGTTPAENLRNGSVFYSNWTSNSSTQVNIVIDNIGFKSTNSANVGAIFYDNCGGIISLRHLYQSGFKYGVVLDQSELVDISECTLQPANNSGACVWFVNGATLTAGNTRGFTNRVSVKSCQLNAGATVNLIQDDGGNTATYEDNNYNGGLHQMTVAGRIPFAVIGGEFEGATGNIVEVTSLTSDGQSVGGSQGTFYGGLYAAGGTSKASIHITSGAFEIGGGINFSGGNGTNPITGSANANQISTGLIFNNTAVQLFDNPPTIRKSVIERQTTAPVGGLYRQGELVLNRDPTAGTVLGWRCTVTGSPGTWETIYPMTGGLPGVATKGDADTTLTPYTDKMTQRFTTTLTANRAITLSTTGAIEGNRFRISRPATGAFNLNVGTGPLKALAAGTWCDVVYDGTAWQLEANGSL